MSDRKPSWLEARRQQTFFTAFLFLLVVLQAGSAFADGSFRDCEICPEMVPLEPAPFVMGYDDGKKAERPSHRVTLSRSFSISRTEVTQGQWKTCVDDGACTPPRFDRGWKGDDRPVIYVTFDDIAIYLTWLSEATGRTYRLPTEEEWEFAAHGGANGSDRPRVTGKGIANCHACDSPFHHKTGPVGSFPPNGYGLYDMLGNVMEWTSSCWVQNYEPGQEIDCTRRVRRGGSWYFNQQVSTPTYRFGARLDEYSYDVGFRVASDSTVK